MKRIAWLLLLVSAFACDSNSEIEPEPEVQAGLLDHRGALMCSDLESLTGPTTLDAECQIASTASVTVTAESAPIRATVERIYEALTDPEQFGAFPRPLPPDFEPPPVPHSVAVASAGEPFIEHYRLFYGSLQTSTVSETHSDDRIEVVQLWRVNPMWTAEEVAQAYPDLDAAEADSLVGTPFMEPGLRTIVTFTIQKVDNPITDYAYISMVQHGLPETSYPIVKQHWNLLYFDPMRAYLEAESP